MSLVERLINKLSAKETLRIDDQRFYVKEQAALRDEFGVNFELEPMPAYMTPKIQNNLAEMGFKAIMHFPKLELKNLAYLRSVGVDRYIAELAREYPNLRPLESLSDREKADVTVSRMLNKMHWKNIMDGKIDFPRLFNGWMAIETIDKPGSRGEYENTSLADKIRLPGNRLAKSWDTVNQALINNRKKILKEVGLWKLPVNLRMFTAEEYNIAANRFDWGATSSWEWTSTEYRDSGVSNRVVIGGGLDNGGAANTNWDRPEYEVDSVGWRAVIELCPANWKMYPFIVQYKLLR